MSDNITSILNELVETSKDGEKGFRSAAENTKNAELQAVFLKRAEDCATGAADLQQLVARLGGNPDQGGSVAGAVHRGHHQVRPDEKATTEGGRLALARDGEGAAGAVVDALVDCWRIHVAAIVDRLACAFDLVKRRR